ncbi:MAG: Bax inhibitor-1/YccA family protein [Pseudomonadota bacterium]
MVNPNYTSNPTVTRAGAAVDAGLQAHMTKVYALMAGAMVISGVVAYIFGMDLKAVVQGQETTLIPAGLLTALFASPLKWAVMFAPLIFVFAFGAMINRLATSTAQIVFWVFAAVMGLSISSIFVVFTGVSIAQTFLVTAIAFGGLSIFGYTTKKDLSGWGTFLIMGVIGLIVASLLNIFFFESSALQFAISALGVLIFAGLTAYDTQNIKNTYLHLRTQPGGEAVAEKAGIMGALSLYLNFLNMFMFLLQFLGNRE